MSITLSLFNLFIAPLPQRGFFTFRSKILRFAGLKLGRNVKVASGVKFFDQYISIGDNAWIGPEVMIHSFKLGPIIIGDSVDIAPRVLLVSGTHRFGHSTRRAGDEHGAEIRIGSGSWVGANVTIISGAKIGIGSIIAAGSVVIAGDYPDNAVLAGAPAQIKKTLSPLLHDLNIADPFE